VLTPLQGSVPRHRDPPSEIQTASRAGQDRTWLAASRHALFSRHQLAQAGSSRADHLYRVVLRRNSCRQRVLLPRRVHCRET